MNLSNTASYAIRAIVFMAREKETLYSAAMLIQELNISDKYLKRILTTLSNAGIIRSVQGHYGGFCLNKSVKDVRLYEVVQSVENIEKYFGCVLGFEECSNVNPCSLHTKWAPLRDELLNFLRNTTIADVIENPQKVRN